MGRCPLEERGCPGPPLIPTARLPPLSPEGPHQGARPCGCQDQRAARAHPAPASDSAAPALLDTVLAVSGSVLPGADGHPRAGIPAQGPGNAPSSSELLHQAPPSPGPLGSFELLCTRPRSALSPWAPLPQGSSDARLSRLRAGAQGAWGPAGVGAGSRGWGLT